MRADPHVHPGLPGVAESRAIDADDPLTAERVMVRGEQGLDALGVLVVDPVGAPAAVPRLGAEQVVQPGT